MSAVEEWAAVRPEANNIMPRLARIADAAIAAAMEDVATMRGILAAAKADEGSRVGWDAARQAGQQVDELTLENDTLRAEIDSLQWKLGEKGLV